MLADDLGMEALGCHGGTLMDHLADSSDFCPALMEVAGADAARKGSLDGRSFAPRLREEPGDPREWVFFHHDPRPGWG